MNVKAAKFALVAVVALGLVSVAAPAQAWHESCPTPGSLTVCMTPPGGEVEHVVEDAVNEVRERVPDYAVLPICLYVQELDTCLPYIV